MLPTLGFHVHPDKRSTSLTSEMSRTGFVEGSVYCMRGDLQKGNTVTNHSKVFEMTKTLKLVLLSGKLPSIKYKNFSTFSGIGLNYVLSRLQELIYALLILSCFISLICREFVYFYFPNDVST